MRILLVGDYSGVHSQLRKTLKSLNHEVKLVSNGDGYKNFDRDLDVPDPIYGKSFFIKFLFVFLDFLGVRGLVTYFNYRKEINKLASYDVVQLMNPIAIPAFGAIGNTLLVNKLKKRNGKVYLCALGDDYFWVDKCLNGLYKYSPLERLSFRNFGKYIYSLRYKYGLFFKLNHFFTLRNVELVIPGLVDYEMAYEGEEKLSSIIKIPLSEELIKESRERLERLELNNFNNKVIKIFHGWQKGKDLRKGNDFLDKAAKIIINKYGEDKVSYQVVSNIPYSDYIELFEQCDIFFDQIYSYDRGVNALLGMAKGKVVFSGFEKEIDNTYSNLTSIGVNAVPDINDIVSTLEMLIENPMILLDVEKEALKYIVKNHDPNLIAEQYLEVWNAT